MADRGVGKTPAEAITEDGKIMHRAVGAYVAARVAEATSGAQSVKGSIALLEGEAALKELLGQVQSFKSSVVPSATMTHRLVDMLYTDIQRSITSYLNRPAVGSDDHWDDD